MNSTIFTFPFEFLLHSCEKSNCSVEAIPKTINYKGCEIRINVPFFTGSNNQTIFPILLKKDLDFLGLSGEGEIPFVQISKNYENIKKANALMIDYINGNNDANIELEIVNGIIRHFRVQSNQYWLNSSIYPEQRLFRCYPVNYTNKNCEILPSPYIFKMDGYPINIKVLHKKNWNDAIDSFVNNRNIIGHEVFLNAINYYHYGYLDSMIINFILSSEIIKNKLYKKIWQYNNPTKSIEDYNDRDVGLVNNTLTDHISDILKGQINRSFKTEFPNEFKYINYCWKFRGKIAHGELPIISHDKPNINLVEVDHLKLMEATLKLNEFLLDLEQSITA